MKGKIVSVIVLLALAIILLNSQGVFRAISEKISNFAAAIMTSAMLTVYDGETATLLSGCLSYGQQVDGGRGGTGHSLKMTPDPWHAPGYSVNCGGQDRLDFSPYEYLEFHIKGNQASGRKDFNIVSYYGRSNTVNILDYVEGGTITETWKKVNIPVSALKTASYNLSAVDTIYFGIDDQSRVFYVDDIILKKKPVAAPAPVRIYTRTPATDTTENTNTQPVVEQPPMPAEEEPKPPVVEEPEDSVPEAPPVVIEKPPVIEEPPVIIEPPVTEQPIAANYADSMYDYDEVDLANIFGQWIFAESKDYISLNFKDRFNTDSVKNLSNYTITSANDANYYGSRRPVSAGYRWRTIYAPTIRLKNLIVAHRIFLRLPSPLQEGKTYTVTANNIGITSKPFTFTFSEKNLNQNIKVNQVGYLPNSKKYAYIGQYMGTAGPMPFAISSFAVKNAVTNQTVYTGKPQLRNIDTNNTGDLVYEMDFSSIKNPGAYIISVPGVGVSYPFRIGSDVYSEVASNALRGAYHQRAGTSLTSEFTRFTHGPAHLDDAYVMNHNPIPTWFRYRFDSQGDTRKKDQTGSRFYYPTSLSGQKITTVRGHYDAGDYGKYVINGALFVGNILAGYEAFPEKLTQDNLQIPESGNGIPDIIDEVKWELDWLENMIDPDDGGVFCIVKPDGSIEYYENRMPDAYSPSKRLLYAKDTTCTGAYAGALAKAGQNTFIKNYYPEAAARYIQKAEKAWQFLSKNSGYLGWHHYGVKDEFDNDKSMDERVWAAMELYGATGKKEYLSFVQSNHKPEYIRWGWNTLFEASGQAVYACAFENRSGMDASLKQRCVNAIVKAADSHVIDANNKRAYRLAMSDAPLNYRDYTYFFPQERIYQLLIANSLKPNPDYIQSALYSWDYTLGANPTSYSYITGIGSKRFREVVSTQSMFDDIKPPVPGLPIGMGNNFGYLDTYGSSLAQMFPPNNGGSPDPKVSYPLLRQIYDSFNIGIEFMVTEISENIISSAYFANASGRNLPPSSISIQATPSSGPAPLSVKFNASAYDPDGSVVRYFWDFDDETYSIRQNPVHVFSDPYKLYKVVLTVTDNKGAEKYKQIDIRTSPAVFSYASSEYANDANTIALFHFNGSLTDENGKYTFKRQGKAEITSNNVQWMKSPRGQSMEFNSVEDTAYVDIPSSAFSKNKTLVAEAKVFAERYLSLNTKSSNIFTLTQGDDKMIGLFDAIYVDGLHITSMNGYNNQKIILTKDDIASLMSSGKMKTGTWFNLKFVIGGGKVRVYANNDKIAESNIMPDFSDSGRPVRVSIGGFKGYIDEIKLSNSL